MARERQNPSIETGGRFADTLLTPRSKIPPTAQLKGAAEKAQSLEASREGREIKILCGLATGCAARQDQETASLSPSKAEKPAQRSVRRKRQDRKRLPMIGL